MAAAIEQCIHCGFCLPTCPTHVVLGEEMDSPRGRIFLMKEVLEGSMEVEEAAPFIDCCVGCDACVTSCPSGVRYDELITPYRAHAEEHRERSRSDRLLRWVIAETLPHPRRFRVAARLGRLARPLRRLAPGRAGAMLDLVPPKLPRARPLPELHPAEGKRRARVALLAGCAQQVLAPEINWATLRVLAANGVEVSIPRAQGCCGALVLHSGQSERAKAQARRNIEAFPSDVDAVVTNAAGCGAGIREYGLLFKGSDEEGEARALAERTVDVSVFLDELGLEPPPGLPEPLQLAYQDACHLAHAQGVRSAPRELLGAIPNLTLLEPEDWELCCGSAGTYNIEQPEVASDLGRRKAEALLATGAEAVATGNIGCLTQIEVHLRALDRELPVLHMVQVLDRAYAQAA
ncbi:MAG: heterodisulfide reductase-related iron-sulfur binding cluster [Actinomycetota bacterium]|nr:heterodisulfide reductase-related iron-sulfur binding cluster [Actinomycetota bacterium]